MTSSATASLRETIVMIRWVLIIACSYLILFADGSGAAVAGPFVIAAFLTSNLLVGRLPEERFATREFKIGIAVLDTLLIAASLYLSGQLSVEMLVLFVAVVLLAAAGLELAVIARVTLILSVADVLLMWLTGSETSWRSSMLLRVPFLLSAGLIYGALVEAGLGASRGSHRIPLVAVDTLSSALTSQQDAIKRCRDGLSDSTAAAALNALNEIAAQNEQMQVTMGRI